MKTKKFTFSELQELRSSLWNHLRSKSLDYRLVDLIHLVMGNCGSLGVEL